MLCIQCRGQRRRASRRSTTSGSGGSSRPSKPRDKVEGTGIGLSVVQEDRRDARRTAWLESASGEGATFHFTWPERPETARVTASERLLNILLVEDDEVDVMNVRRAFEKNHITNPLFVAGNGVEALEKLRNGKIPRERRIVLLDLNMPRMNGIEFLRELRADPVLQLDARRRAHDVERRARRSRRTT